MDNLEQECEDAVFEVCDARERYPLRCAEEFEKCIKLTSELHMKKVAQRPVRPLSIPTFTEEQNALLDARRCSFRDEDTDLQRMLNTVENLKAVLEQVERQKTCEFLRLLNS